MVSSSLEKTYAADDAGAAIDLLRAVHGEHAPEALAQLHCLAPEVLDSDVVAPLIASQKQIMQPRSTLPASFLFQEVHSHIHYD